MFIRFSSKLWINSGPHNTKPIIVGLWKILIDLIFLFLSISFINKEHYNVNLLVRPLKKYDRDAIFIQEIFNLARRKKEISLYFYPIMVLNHYGLGSGIERGNIIICSYKCFKVPGESEWFRLGTHITNNKKSKNHLYKSP